MLSFIHTMKLSLTRLFIRPYCNLQWPFYFCIWDALCQRSFPLALCDFLQSFTLSCDLTVSRGGSQYLGLDSTLSEGFLHPHVMKRWYCRMSEQRTGIASVYAMGALYATVVFVIWLMDFHTLVVERKEIPGAGGFWKKRDLCGLLLLPSRWKVKRLWL